MRLKVTESVTKGKASVIISPLSVQLHLFCNKTHKKSSLRLQRTFENLKVFVPTLNIINICCSSLDETEQKANSMRSKLTGTTLPSGVEMKGTIS